MSVPAERVTIAVCPLARLLFPVAGRLIAASFFRLPSDAPRVRQTDISFALTVVLHALNPPSRPANAKSLGPGEGGERARGSLSVHSGGGGDQRSGNSQARGYASSRPTLVQVAFLGMKVLMTCFVHQLALDWPRVARCIREIDERREGGGAFWNFLIFVSTQRGPLYPLILPLMWNKVELAFLDFIRLEHERRQL